MHQLSGRSLTIAYTFALSIIALMSLASHITLDEIIQAHQGAASVINISGRQRMLSQRIAGLIAERALDMPVQQDLERAINQFEAAHADLLQGSESRSLPPASSRALHAIYFEGSQPLDAGVKDFIARARVITGLLPHDPRAKSEAAVIFAQAREPILASLDKVVSVHQATSEKQMQTLEWMQTASISVIIATLIFEALAIFRPMVRRIGRFIDALKRIAANDPLTGALNRRSFQERTTAEMARASRYGRPTSLIMIDVDRFKSINDHHGHAGGDAVLQAITAAIASDLRPSDTMARVGGEEFAVLLAETDLAGAAIVAERLRGTVAALAVDFNGAPIRCTISAGVIEIDQAAMTLSAAMEKVDQALYQAKNQGRNRVVLSQIIVAAQDKAAA